MRWAVEGFGHCPLERDGLRVATPSLPSCLRRCRRLGPRRCRFASHVDADVLRLSGRHSGACQLSRWCPTLQAVTLGAVTYRRSPGQGWPGPEAAWNEAGMPDIASEAVVTLAPAAPFAAANAWRPQLCTAKDGSRLSLRRTCRPARRGRWRLSREGSAGEGTGVLRISESATGRWLCAEHGEVLLKRDCRASARDWEVEAPDLRPSGESQPHADFQAGVRLRLAGRRSYLGVAAGRGPVLLEGPDFLHALNRSRRARPFPPADSVSWAIGLQQPRRSELFEIDRGGRHCLRPSSRREDLPVDVWMLASRSYTRLLKNACSSLEATGEPTCVHTRWCRDMRDVNEGHWTLGLDSFFFSLRRFLLIKEAFLSTLGQQRTGAPEGQAPALAILDLDVQVFPGWRRAIRACLGGRRGADICFPQQPPHPWEEANAGIQIFRGDSQTAAAMVSVELAKLQALEVFLRLFPGSRVNFDHQQRVNAVLAQVRRHRGPRSLRWGIYHPEVIPVRATAAGLKPLRVSFFHATGAIDIRQKFQLLERVATLVRLAGELCGSGPPPCAAGQGDHCPALGAQGPLLPVCLYLLPSDPHFGEPFETCRVYRGFSGVAEHASAMDRRLKIQVLASDFASRPAAAAILELLQSD
mmetsp:Transcript_59892/g.188035  ORF Transcript_59892/g.188035 Transcript_59892/m.188035 type:complete len:640 (-) Transcript_59892:65-1984(-)